jgi:RNA polymerase-binding transcription factor DksA
VLDFDDPIPTISFVSLWAGILQAVDLLNDISGQETAGLYTICLSCTRPLIRRKLTPTANCPVSCQAAQSYARTAA